MELGLPRIGELVRCGIPLPSPHDPVPSEAACFFPCCRSANSLFAAGCAIRYLKIPMFFDNRGRDIQPLTRLGSLPVYGTTILIAALVVGLIASSLSQGFGLLAIFDPESFWKRGQVWRGVSYLAVDHVNFFTIFNLLFLYSFKQHTIISILRLLLRADERCNIYDNSRIRYSTFRRS